MVSLRRLLPCILLAASIPGLAAPADSPADVKAGAVLFRDKGCSYCHGATLQGTKKAPSLADIRIDKAWPPEKMTDQILNGGVKMPPFRDSLSDEEIAQLIAYLRARDRPAPPAGEAPPPPSH